MKKLYIALIAAIHFLLLGGILAVDVFAETGETAKNNAGRAVITFENDLIDADMSTPGVDAMENPESMRLAAEEQEARQELINQAKLERSLNALNSEHPHLRAMAVDELVSLKDPRTTSALAGAANSKELDSEERRRVVEALWHHAGDLEFADPTANEALQQMASDGDPAVREIARRALHDMERYRRRNNK